MPDWLKEIALPIGTSLVVAAATWGGMRSEVTANSKALEKTVTREEFMSTFGQIQHQLSEIHADIRQLNGRVK